LGLQPHAVSAISGTGTGEMMDALAKTLPPPRDAPSESVDDAPLAVAIVGRPNVGARARASWEGQQRARRRAPRGLLGPLRACERQSC
jgi:hypothetical protein